VAATKAHKKQVFPYTILLQEGSGRQTFFAVALIGVLTRLGLNNARISLRNVSGLTRHARHFSQNNDMPVDNNLQIGYNSRIMP